MNLIACIITAIIVFTVFCLLGYLSEQQQKIRFDFNSSLEGVIDRANYANSRADNLEDEINKMKQRATIDYNTKLYTSGDLEKEYVIDDPRYILHYLEENSSDEEFYVLTLKQPAQTLIGNYLTSHDKFYGYEDVLLVTKQALSDVSLHIWIDKLEILVKAEPDFQLTPIDKEEQGTCAIQEDFLKTTTKVKPR